MERIEHQLCPVCRQNTLSLIQDEKDIPNFGTALIFAMNCSSCLYHQADVEATEEKQPARYTIEINSEKDMKIHVIKSSSATIKIPQLKMSVTPGPASDGYISNIEGLLDRFKEVIESERDTTEDEEVKKKAKNLLKKIWKVKLGDIPIKIIIEDPSGNSAILSEKVIVERLKK